jgi:hypothetical protein
MAASATQLDVMTAAAPAADGFSRLSVTTLITPLITGPITTVITTTLLTGGAGRRGLR